MGDFNANIGSDKVENIVGPCGIGDTNGRGEKLIEWCKANDLLSQTHGLKITLEDSGHG